MFDPFSAPGLRYLGLVSNDHVNHGQPLPLFEPIPPKDRPSINTLEGWKAFCERVDRVNRESFINFHGREPKNADELEQWLRGAVIE